MRERELTATLCFYRDGKKERPEPLIKTGEKPKVSGITMSMDDFIKRFASYKN